MNHREGTYVERMTPEAARQAERLAEMLMRARGGCYAKSLELLERKLKEGR